MIFFKSNNNRPWNSNRIYLILGGFLTNKLIVTAVINTNNTVAGYPLRVTLSYYQILFTQVQPLAQLRCLEASKIVSTIFPVDGVVFLKISTVD